MVESRLPVELELPQPRIRLLRPWVYLPTPLLMNRPKDRRPSVAGSLRRHNPAEYWSRPRISDGSTKY